MLTDPKLVGFSRVTHVGYSTYPTTEAVPSTMSVLVATLVVAVAVAVAAVAAVEAAVAVIEVQLCHHSLCVLPKKEFCNNFF